MFNFLNRWHKPDGRPAEKECEICCEAYGGEANAVSCSRGHTFCVSCFRAYAKEAIFGMSKAALPCMAQNCREKYSESLAKRLLDGRLFKKLRENGGRCTCRCTNCNWKTKAEVSHLSKADRERLEREESLTNKAVRRCPECKKAIVKEGGCNHVVCPSCETHMCYSCGARVEAYDYEHVCYGRESPVRTLTHDMFGQVGPWQYRHRAWPGFHGHFEENDRFPEEVEIVNWPYRLSRMTFDAERNRTAVSASSALSVQVLDTGLHWREPTLVEKRLKDAVRLTTLFQRPGHG